MAPSVVGRIVLTAVATWQLRAVAAVDDATGPSTATPEVQSDLVTVCPAAGKYGLAQDSAGRPRVVGKNCEAVAELAVVDGTLDASSAHLDLVLSYPDVPTLNLAYNNLQVFPLAPETRSSSSSITSLNLRQNLIKSLRDVGLPPKLEYLDLGRNRLSALEAVSYPSTLRTLRLGANNLRRLNASTLPSGLKALELDDQPLGAVSVHTLPPTLETLGLSNCSLVNLNASMVLPASIVSLDISSNALTKFPDLFQFPSIAQVNASFNAIKSLRGVQFPWTLKRLDLRGNSIQELEIKRSDLKLFQDWNYLLPSLSQSNCRNPRARRVRVREVDLCVLEDDVFDVLYLGTAYVGSSSGSTIIDTVHSPQPTTSAESTMEGRTSESSSLSWTFLIVAIVTIAMAVIGIIAMLSWKHQQLRNKMKNMVTRGQHRTSSFNGDLLRAVGLQGEIIATRFEADELRILEVLGCVGYAIIYLAELRDVNVDRDMISSDDDLSTDDLENATKARNLVTVKRMVPEQSVETSASLRSFIQEIHLMSQLEHPKIVGFVGISWNTLMDVSLIMEYLPNGDLRALLRSEKDRQARGKSRRLRWFDSQTSFASTMSIATSYLPSKISIALDIAEALVYLHSFTPPVIHRELRSKHVRFSRHHDAKLCNFGAPGDAALDVTRTTALDSVAWIAPEILRGDVYSEMSDIYSFGILLTELATCERPFDGVANAAVALKVTSDHARPSLDDAECPDPIQDIAHLCMAPESRHRPTAAELHRELSALRRHLAQRRL